jgi:hypothetical protein
VTERETLTEEEREDVAMFRSSQVTAAKALRIIDAQAARIARLESDHMALVDQIRLAQKQRDAANARADAAERRKNAYDREAALQMMERQRAESEAASLRATLDRVQAFRERLASGCGEDGQTRAILQLLDEAIGGVPSANRHPMAGTELNQYDTPSAAPSGQPPVPEPERPEQPEHE